MIYVFAARIAKFLKFQATSRFLFILGRHVIFIFAFFANERDVISRHFSTAPKQQNVRLQLFANYKLTSKILVTIQ